MKVMFHFHQFGWDDRVGRHNRKVDTRGKIFEKLKKSWEVL